MEIGLMDIIQFVMNVGQHKYTCSLVSYSLVYAILAMSLVISAGGVYVWLRFVRTQPRVKVSGVLLIENEKE